MADDADRADSRIEETISDGIIEARLAIANFDSGEAGTCDYCGGEFDRLVDGACGFCRDRYRLK